MLLSEQRDTAAARRLFTRALTRGPAPVEVITDKAGRYLRVLDQLVPTAMQVTEQHGNNRIEAEGVGTTALGLGLMDALRGWSGRVGSAFVMAAGVGLGIAGLARNDCSSELPSCAAAVDAGDVSVHHQIHDLVSLLIFLALIVAQLVCARAFRQDPQWRDLRTYSLVSGVLMLALLVLFIADAIDGWNGIVQRIFLAVPWIWIVVLGLRLLRLATPRSQPDWTAQRTK